MLPVAKRHLKIRHQNDPEKRLRRWLELGTSRHLVAVAHEKRTACKGAQQKEVGHDDRQIPAIYLEVLVLRFQEELHIEEMAGGLSVPLSTVKSRLYRGLEALRSVLQEGAP